MLTDNLRTSSRKGITPIIATVLLLGITVAIGLTVYTQAQGLIQDAGNTDQFDQVRATEIALSPVFSDGEMQLQVSNKGERAINVTKYTIYYGPPNWDPVSYSTIKSQTEWNTSGGNDCFTSTMISGGDILEPGERAGCGTGVEFPGSLEAVEIRVEADNFDYSTSYTCSVESSSAMSC